MPRCHEGMCKLDDLLKLIATDSFISFGQSGQLVLPMQDALFKHAEWFPLK